MIYVMIYVTEEQKTEVDVCIEEYMEYGGKFYVVEKSGPVLASFSFKRINALVCSIFRSLLFFDFSSKLSQVLTNRPCVI